MFTLFSSTHFNWKKSYISNCECKWSWMKRNCRFQNDRQRIRNKSENAIAAWLWTGDYFVYSIEKKFILAYHVQSLTLWSVSYRFYCQSRFDISTFYYFSAHSQKSRRYFFIFLCHSIRTSNSMNVFVSLCFLLFIRYFL